MPTCRDIITRAMQMAKVLPIGDEPSADEANAGLDALNGMYERWVTTGMFGAMKDVYATSDLTAGENERITITSGAVTLPTTIDDERTPRDLSVVEIFETGARQVWVYDRNAWVSLGELGLSDEAPLALRGRSGLAACLAAEWVELFGGEITSSIARTAAAFRLNIATKQGSTQNAHTPDYY